MESSSKTLSPVSEKIGKINFSGDIIPANWYDHIVYTHKRGTYADLLAIAILANVIYWYRPYQPRDKETDKPMGYVSKFEGDMLQKSVSQYSQKYGFSKDVVRKSIRLLEELGLIRTELRRVVSKKGRVLTNVMFIEPIVDKVIEITFQTKGTLQMGSSPTCEIASTPTCEMASTYTESTLTKNKNTTTTDLVIDPLIIEVFNKWNLLAVSYNLSKVTIDSVIGIAPEIMNRLKDPLFDFDKICEKIKNSKVLRGIGKGQSKAKAVTFLSLIRSENYFTDILSSKYDDEAVITLRSFEERWGECRNEFCAELEKRCAKDLEVVIDSTYYYVAVKAWAGKIDRKSADWIADTISYFCLKDKGADKLKTIVKPQLQKRKNYGL